MTILYVTDSFAVWGGMERVLADKMNYQVENYGYHICLLTVNQGNHTQPYSLNSQIQRIDLGVRLHQQYNYGRIKRFFIRRHIDNILEKKILESLFRLNVDVIVCVKLDFVGVLNKVRGKIPLVVESHTLCKADCFEGVGWLRRLHVWTFKRQVRNADVLVALTDKDANDWREYCKKVYGIPNIVRLNESNDKSESIEKKAIFVGRYSKQKDIDSLLKIWSIVHSRHFDWTLEIFCDRTFSAPGVKVYKPVPDIMEKYIQSSVLLLTSLFEPFGLVLPEAMSCGLPVVAFDCPYGPADIITDGVDGFLVKNRDINEFADRVCQLIEDKELRVKMGQAAIKSSQRYRADMIMPKWKSLFEQICQKE